VLAAAEESGRVRRGYFVESLGAAQFSTTGAVDRLRAGARPPGEDPDARPGPALVLAATDPANAYGAALPWPDRPGGDGPEALDQVDLSTSGSGAAKAAANASGSPARTAKRGHQPARKAGALVVQVDGELVLYVERGGKTLLSWTDDAGRLQSAADALALAVREGALGRLTVEKADGGALLGSGHPLVQALANAGFHATPRGLRLRR
jgi:ATP-dependent Lhr-like helicase